MSIPAVETCHSCGVKCPVEHLRVGPTDELGERFGNYGRCDKCWTRLHIVAQLEDLRGANLDRGDSIYLDLEDGDVLHVCHGRSGGTIAGVLDGTCVRLVDIGDYVPHLVIDELIEIAAQLASYVAWGDTAEARDELEASGLLDLDAPQYWDDVRDCLGVDGINNARSLWDHMENNGGWAGFAARYCNECASNDVYLRVTDVERAITDVLTEPQNASDFYSYINNSDTLSEHCGGNDEVDYYNPSDDDLDDIAEVLEDLDFAMQGYDGPRPELIFGAREFLDNLHDR